MKTLFKLLAIALIFTSCDDVEPVIYNGDPAQNDTFLSFSRSVYLLPVVQNDVGEAIITFNSSTVYDVDRVYNIEVELPDNPSAANPATFSVPTTVTIPAGSYQGTFTITGVDDNLVDETIKTFTINVTNADETFEFSDSLSATVNVYEVCPLQDDFLGAYTIEVNEDYFTDLPGFGAGEVILEEGNSPFEREFTADTYPGTGGPERVTIAFACNFLNLGENIDTGIICDADDDNGLTFAPVDLEDRSAYDTTDDSYFEMTVVENAIPNSCAGGPAPRNTIIRFTKVE